MPVLSRRVDLEILLKSLKAICSDCPVGWTLDTDDNLCRPDDVTLTCKSNGFKINFPLQALYWDSESMTETERETAVATIGTEFFLIFSDQHQKLNHSNVLISTQTLLLYRISESYF